VKRRFPLIAAALAALTAAALVNGPMAGNAGATPTHRSAGNPSSHTSATPIYLNRSYSAAERAADLVSRMTLAEKASQLNSSQAAAIPRLGIAAYGWWNEAAHGVAREGTLDNANPPTLTNTTSYPVDLSAGSTWNPGLIYDEASLISDEARDVVRNNSLDLDFYSPTVNLSRDPRWGRNDETFSEDPTLTAAIASQFVNGMQGQTPTGAPLPGSAGYAKTLATIKHFAANNSEYNRRTGSSDMDERTLREYYTAQFRDIIDQSNPGSIMSAYNEVNGVPAAANVHLIDTLARQTYGFDGYFTSDCDAVYEMQAGHHWTPPNSAVPVDQITRTAYANAAGEDLDCQQGYHDQYSYANTIPTAVAQGIHTQTDTYNENDVDVSAVRLFTARISLGEFDAQDEVPWVAAARQRLAPGTWTNSDANNAVTETPQRLAMARKVGDQSLVLLKNQPVGNSALLPLKVPGSGAYRVAVIGQYANPSNMYLGGYSSDQGAAGVAKEVNGYQGLKAAIQHRDPNATVDFLPGTSADISTVDAQSVAKAAGYDAVIVYAGTDANTAGEDTDRKTLALPGAQNSLISQVAAANPHTIVYLETMGAVDVGSFAGKVPAILWSSYNGQRKGESLADVVLGAYNPSGRLPFTWYADVNQLPAIGDYTIRPTATDAGRTYEYFTGSVSYPFGYGLSYASFRYSNLRVDRRHVDANGAVRVSATVTNSSSTPGDDVIQLYATTPDAPAALQRPIKRLESFDKISLKAHQSKRVSFTVPVSQLAFFDQNSNRYQVDRGRYGLQLASSATGVQQQAFITVSGSLRPTPATVTAKPVARGDAAKGIQQRVYFPAGATIDPQLTVSLTDESLFGYITAGQRRQLPAGMTVRYTSNRPSVVSIGEHSTIKARHSGVATVTACVTYHGRRATGSFVVDVR
jgi:beta-glucosidase